MTSSGALTNRLLTAKRTQSTVAAVAKKRADGKTQSSHTLNQLRGQLGQANKRVRNLLDALADGLAGDTALFKEAFAKAERERDEMLRLIQAQEGQVKEALKPITDDEARIASAKLRQMLIDAPAELKKCYIRAFVAEIVVGKSEIVISGSKDALAEAVSGEPLAHLAATSEPVRSSVPEWRE